MKSVQKLTNQFTNQSLFDRWRRQDECDQKGGVYDWTS